MAATNASTQKKTVKRDGNKSSKPPAKGNGNGNGHGHVEHLHVRAYEIYQERLRNNQPGDMISDWVQAEQEIDVVVTGKKGGH